MKKIFGLIALLGSSSLALVSPALARDWRSNDAYTNQNYSSNRYTVYDNGYGNSHVARNDRVLDNRYVDARHDYRPARESNRLREWHREDVRLRDCR